MKQAASNQLEDILEVVHFDNYVSNSWKIYVKEFIFSVVILQGLSQKLY